MEGKVVRLMVIAMLLMFTVTSCAGDGDGSVTLTFNQVPGDCATANQSTGAIQCDDSVLTFDGSVITSNPCYYLTAKLDFMNTSNIVIAITAASALSGDSASCVECVGEIAFSGELSPVGSCLKSVSIVYNGDTIAGYDHQ